MMGTMFVSEGDWCRWFAWHPVKIGGQWTWLSYVRRRAVHCTVPEIGMAHTLYEYRQSAV